MRRHRFRTLATLAVFALAVAGAQALVRGPAPAGAALRVAGAGTGSAVAADTPSLQQLQDEARATREQMLRLTADQALLVQKCNQAQQRLDEVNAQLVAARQGLALKRRQLDAQRSLVGNRMKAMYKAGEFTWLDLVSSSSSLSDAETVLEFLRLISLEDRHNETDLQKLTGEARKLEHDVEAERKKAFAAQIELDDQRAQLEAKIAERSAVLRNLVTRIKKILSAPMLLMKSGGKVTQITWAQALLKSMGLPLTADNVAAIVAWEMAEGGHWYNTAYYNPLNTTQSMPGATVFNSVGVKAYKSWKQGLDATVITLRNGYYGGILDALQRGNDAQAVADAVAASPWGTGSFTPKQ